jgi:hypothetical protein
MPPILRPSALPDNNFLQHAIEYATRGWSIVPVAGKKPIGLWRPFQTSPPTEATLRRLFAKPGITGLGVVLGAVSGGLAVRDFDGAEACHAWAAANPNDAAIVPTVQTARGFHVYGRLDDEQFIDFGDGELRASSGHIVILPPSVHPDGPIYRWLNPLPPPGKALPPLPRSLLERQQKQGRSKQEPAEAADPCRSIAWWKGFSTYVFAKTLPTRPGQRNRKLFDLAREIKAINPDATTDELRAIVRAWCREALPRTSGEHGFGDCWTDFLTAWRRVKRPAGRSLAAAAATAANHVPEIAVRLGYDGGLLRPAALCWQLQRQWGNRPFPLGCEVAGHYLGVTARRAGQLLKTLRDDEVLERATEGRKKQDGEQAGRASEYRFLGE